MRRASSAAPMSSPPFAVGRAAAVFGGPGEGASRFFAAILGDPLRILGENFACAPAEGKRAFLGRWGYNACMETGGVCPRAAACELYALAKVQQLLEVWKVNYCQADFGRCERYKRAMAAEAVPLTLLPDGQTLQLPKG
jgi:hypothetical protein